MSILVASTTNGLIARLVDVEADVKVDETPDDGSLADFLLEEEDAEFKEVCDHKIDSIKDLISL